MRKYDSRDVERIAGKVAALSGSVTAAANGGLKRTADELPVHFKGEAALELQTSLKGLFSDVHSCANKLNNLSEMLKIYAQMLKQADEEAEAAIGKH